MNAAKVLKTAAVKLAVRSWVPYSKLFIAGDRSQWVLEWERREVLKIAKSIGVGVSRLSIPPTGVERQSVYFGGPYFILDDGWFDRELHLGFDFYHGFPETSDVFKRIYSKISRDHRRIKRIRVSHERMYRAVLETGIESDKVFKIPIGINLDFFPYRTLANKKKARSRLGLPGDAKVVGSFQKDGIGWGDGEEPKLIKGPDVFVEVMRRVKEHVPNLHVLLSGPSRGYVKRKLNEYGIAYTHVYLRHYPDIADLYSCLDLYLVSSRVEGGPKAILESMSSGVPLLTTSVGQAEDLVRHGDNGWVVEPGNFEGLTSCAVDILELNNGNLDKVLSSGRKTAEENSYNAQTPLWRTFFKGFVEF